VGCGDWGRYLVGSLAEGWGVRVVGGLGRGRRTVGMFESYWFVVFFCFVISLPLVVYLAGQLLVVVVVFDSFWLWVGETTCTVVLSLGAFFAI
jgi:hypothetical protein